MKKKYKALVVFAGATAAAVAFNKIVSYIDGEKVKYRAGNAGARKKYKEMFYKWRYGKVRYVKCGNGEPLLLIHDTTASSGLDDWMNVIELLKKHYTVYAPDLPGFGCSVKPALTYSAYLYASFINDFIKHCAGGKAYAVACGGSAAFAAAGCVLKPALYKKMMLIYDKEGKNQYLPVSKQKLFKWLARIFELPVYGTFIINVLALKTTGKHRRSRFTGDRHVLSAALKNYLWADTHKLVKKIKIPVRIIKPKSLTEKPRLFYRACCEFLAPDHLQ